MNQLIKAVRKTLTIGGFSVEAFQLPDGSYRIGQSSASEMIGKRRASLYDFCQTKKAETLAGSGSVHCTVFGSQKPMKPLHKADLSIVTLNYSDTIGKPANGMALEAVTAYWQHWADKGNEQAKALINALATEALERRLDDEFGVVKTVQERNETLKERIARLLTEAGLPYGKNVPTPRFSETLEKRSLNPKTAHESWQVIDGVTWFRLPGTDTWQVDADTANYSDYCLWREWYPGADLPLHQAIAAFKLIKSTKAA